jgi:predicted nucleotidyltransferase
VSIFRTGIRLPLWVAVVAPACAYVYRSFARGWDFRPDMPLDVIVLVVYAAALVAVSASRRESRSEDAGEDPRAEQDEEDDSRAD